MSMPPELIAKILEATGQPTTAQKIFSALGPAGAGATAAGAAAPVAAPATTGLFGKGFRFLTHPWVAGPVAGLKLGEMAEPALRPGMDWAGEKMGLLNKTTRSPSETPELSLLMQQRAALGREYSSTKNPALLSQIDILDQQIKEKNLAMLQPQQEQQPVNPMLLALSGLGQGGQGFSFSTPRQQYNVNLPTAPDLTRAAPQLRGLTEQDRMQAVLAGLASGLMPTIGNRNISRGEALLQGGLGTMLAQAQHGQRAGEIERENALKMADFNRWKESQNFQNQLGLAEAQLKLQEANKAPQPIIKEDYAFIPQIQGDKVVWQAKPLESPKTNQMMRLMLGGAREPDQQAMYNTLLKLNPNAALLASRQIMAGRKQGEPSVNDLKMLGAGEKDTAHVAAAQVLDYIRKNDPKGYSQLENAARQQMLQDFYFKALR